MDSTVLSISTTTPLRSPRDGLEPTPMMLKVPSSVTSDTIAQIFVVPISNPTRIWSRFATASPPFPDDHPVVIAQIYVVTLMFPSIESRHPERRFDFHEAFPLILERVATEMKSYSSGGGDKIYGVSHVELDTSIYGFGHPSCQLDCGLNPLLDSKITLRQERAVHARQEWQGRLVAGAKAGEDDAFAIDEDLVGL